jgi:hypothetical protein
MVLSGQTSHSHLSTASPKRPRQYSASDANPAAYVAKARKFRNSCDAGPIDATPTRTRRNIHVSRCIERRGAAENRQYGQQQLDFCKSPGFFSHFLKSFTSIVSELTHRRTSTVCCFGTCSLPVTRPAKCRSHCWICKQFFAIQHTKNNKQSD